MRETVRVACVQVEPVILDRDRTIDKLAQYTAEAAREGAQLLRHAAERLLGAAPVEHLHRHELGVDAQPGMAAADSLEQFYGRR